MKLAEYCQVSHGYIGEIESGRKFPSTELIEKIANVLRIEPYLIFKDGKDSSFLINNVRNVPPLPYNIKKLIKEKIKTQVKSQIKSQITTQVNLSLDEIINGINEILDSN